MNLKVFVETLGCAKNLVDSEVMMGLLTQNDYMLTKDKFAADIVIVNTCGFIEAAKQESIDTIIDLGQLKNDGNCKLLVVAGCLGERYAEDLMKELPEVDAIIGTGNFPEIIQILDDTLQGKKIIKSGDINIKVSEDLPRFISTPRHTAYLKIADGCDNGCTYCIIPKLRGSYRSRDMEQILKEARSLAQEGVKEIILIAQDTTRYGIDLYGEYKLSDLLKKLCTIDQFHWIRILYCYPDEITEELIDVIAKEKKICKYLDMPIQHCNNQVLKRMNRRTSKEHILKVIEKLRNQCPDIALRTSLIVGFPGESDEQHEELKQFVEIVQFDRLGVFTYSQEEDTPAANFPDQIAEELKEKRRDEIMRLQQQISYKKNMEKIGNIYDILVEEKVEGESVYIGRTAYDAPEIDGVVYVHAEKTLHPGALVRVLIKDALEYDLMGEMLNEPCQ
ncbi:30S ribosomal protein S12 methylthiotransferase RimO [Geosporobacter ferrireducens]|uniref:Ribosomal protein uS12 methylthiotransferase RimO n=1 Tax=Geosporobacter ferrireducens TaxID=1424294 RepID=A0A1D8GBD8_9FIRM|nr:30S ribosomal protein S12 methylthiotransferase RimO [Geosporobacter ferrireducens]AOT68221.1 ribosomal protein S12 methylthiotransferase RimO [Geosporobacter ferrireducens]MTI57361.1 30S ribosomal protein S12 methylthiotransferase RimO [Geosporobacter ferrireducens]